MLAQARARARASTRSAPAASWSGTTPTPATACTASSGCAELLFHRVERAQRGNGGGFVDRVVAFVRTRVVVQREALRGGALRGRDDAVDGLLHRGAFVADGHPQLPPRETAFGEVGRGFAAEALLVPPQAGARGDVVVEALRRAQQG